MVYFLKKNVGIFSKQFGVDFAITSLCVLFFACICARFRNSAARSVVFFFSHTQVVLIIFLVFKAVILHSFCIAKYVFGAFLCLHFIIVPTSSNTCRYFNFYMGKSKFQAKYESGTEMANDLGSTCLEKRTVLILSLITA